MKKVFLSLLLIAMLCVSIVFAGCIDDSLNANNNSNNNNNVDVKTFCELVSEITGIIVNSPEDAPIYFVIGSDDSYCQIDTNPYDMDDFTSSTALSYIESMNEKLELPDYLYNDMLHTSYSQGKQEETFENIKVKYYYHPDKGLNVTYYRI